MHELGLDHSRRVEIARGEAHVFKVAYVCSHLGELTLSELAVLENRLVHY